MALKMVPCDLQKEQTGAFQAAPAQGMAEEKIYSMGGPRYVGINSFLYPCPLVS